MLRVMEVSARRSTAGPHAVRRVVAGQDPQPRRRQRRRAPGRRYRFGRAARTERADSRSSPSVRARGVAGHRPPLGRLPRAARGPGVRRVGDRRVPPPC
ncbi:hypothetical protein HBB16_15315 [Pseudonocardia sp. MCCB 268]|nr:hypothetical protein [Pseudonocardia cytotoxica]